MSEQQTMEQFLEQIRRSGGCTDTSFEAPGNPGIGGRYLTSNEQGSANLKPGDLLTVWCKGVQSPAAPYSRELILAFVDAGISLNSDYGSFFSVSEYKALRARADAVQLQASQAP